jgi:hypothetical protein
MRIGAAMDTVMCSSMWTENRTRPYTPGAPQVAHMKIAQPRTQPTVLAAGHESPRARIRRTPRRYRVTASTDTTSHSQSMRQTVSQSLPDSGPAGAGYPVREYAGSVLPTGVSGPGGALRESAVPNAKAALMMTSSMTASFAKRPLASGSSVIRLTTRERCRQPARPSATSATTLRITSAP